MAGPVSFREVSIPLSNHMIAFHPAGDQLSKACKSPGPVRFALEMRRKVSPSPCFEISDIRWHVMADAFRQVRQTLRTFIPRLTYVRTISAVTADQKSVSGGIL